MSKCPILKMPLITHMKDVSVNFVVYPSVITWSWFVLFCLLRGKGLSNVTLKTVDQTTYPQFLFVTHIGGQRLRFVSVFLYN